MNAQIVGKLSPERLFHVVEAKTQEIRKRAKEAKRRERAKKESRRDHRFNPIRGLERLSA